MKCHYFKNNSCRSCDLLDLTYADSLLLKEAELKQLFPLSIDCIKPSVGLTGVAENSRNKAKFAVIPQNGGLQFGFYHSDGSYQALENCSLHEAGINDLLPGLRDILNHYGVRPYDIQSKSGELKYCLISASKKGDAQEILLRFVCRSKKLLSLLSQAVPEILGLSSAIKVISVNIQPVHQAILEGDEEIVLTTQKSISHVFDEFTLLLGTRSFFQVTSEIAKALYNAVAVAIEYDAPTSVLDLYCGVGAFSFYAARHCADVTGVEISAEAIACAQAAAAINHKAITFTAMDVEAYLAKPANQFDAVIINPPRRGLNAKIIESIKRLEPRFIYYSSCNAKSLARDVELLSDRYLIKSLQIFDMFPHTKHYETLMCLAIR